MAVNAIGQTTGVILTQRELYADALREITGAAGNGILETVEDVEAFWQLWARRAGFKLRNTGEAVYLGGGGHADTNIIESAATIPAYVNHGRWVADCPNCNAGIAVWPENPRALCLGCGFLYRIAFPDDTQAVEEALAPRRVEHRHWTPAGKTPDELHAENELIPHLTARDVR